MIWQIYLRKNLVFVPTTAKTTQNFYQDIDPVNVVPVGDTTKLMTALQDVVTRGNPIIPAPSPSKEDVPVVQKAAGLKSWSSFARLAIPFHIQQNTDGFRIIGNQPMKPRGWAPDPEQTITFPPDAKLEEVCARMASILQERAET